MKPLTAQATPADAQRVPPRLAIPEELAAVVSTAGRLHLRCTQCGYGAIAHSMPTQCPMCRCVDWDYDEWRPFSSDHGGRRE
jgi:rubrerythrin